MLAITLVDMSDERNSYCAGTSTDDTVKIFLAILPEMPPPYSIDQ
jgi:hypothetical protein